VPARTFMINKFPVKQSRRKERKDENSQRSIQLFVNNQSIFKGRLMPHVAVHGALLACVQCWSGPHGYK
jgi:hypothetical protein